MMGSVHPGDEHLHHADWSHAWSGGPDNPAGQQQYQAELRAHVAAHRAGEQGEPSRSTRVIQARQGKPGDRFRGARGREGSP